MKAKLTKCKNRGRLLLASLALFSLTGCLDTPDFKYTGEGKDLPEITSFFDYVTEKEVNLTIQYTSATTSIPFEVFTQYPLMETTLEGEENITTLVRNPDITAFAAGLTNKEGELSTAIKLPASVKEIYIYTNSIGVEQCHKVSNAEGAINAIIPSFNVERPEEPVEQETRNTTTETKLINSYSTSNKNTKLTSLYGNGLWYVNGAPYESTLEEIDNRIVEAADLLRNNSISVNKNRGMSKTAFFLNKYLLTDDFVVASDGEVVLQVLSTQGDWGASLAYYVYEEGDIDPSNPASLTTLENMQKYMILPMARCGDAGNTGETKPLTGIVDSKTTPKKVSTIKLINPDNKNNPDTKYTFKRGTRIGFALYVGRGTKVYYKKYSYSTSYAHSGKPVVPTANVNYTTSIAGKNALTIPETPTSNGDIDYSKSASNPCRMAASVKVDGLKDKDGNPLRYEVFGLEHDRWGSNSDFDFDDVIFGLTNIIGSDELIEELPPAEINKKGLLLFEDLWPLAGDYDMNDLVAKYDITHYVDEKESYLIKSVYNFKVVWAGASYYNSFNLLLQNANAIERIEDHYTTTVPGFPDGVISSQVQNIKNDSDKEGLILRLDNPGASIPEGLYMKICQDVQWLFQRHGPTQHLPEAEYKFTVHYKPFTSSLGFSNELKPFINVQDVMPASSREVHLLGDAPTSLNRGTHLFNVENSNDRSYTPQADGKTYWYAGANYLPFAINLVDPGDGSVLNIDFYKRQHFINSRNEAVEYQESIDKYFPDFLKWTAREPGYEDWWKNYVQPDYSDRHY